MKIIRKRIADMERATYNPRVELQPGDAEYETLKRSLEQFGMVEPVVWNERTTAWSAATRGSPWKQLSDMRRSMSAS